MLLLQRDSNHTILPLIDTWMYFLGNLVDFKESNCLNENEDVPGTISKVSYLKFQIIECNFWRNPSHLPVWAEIEQIDMEEKKRT